MTEAQADEMREWLLERPPAVQDAILAFPPGSTVVSKPGVTLMVPAPDCVGQVISYRERMEGEDVACTRARRELDIEAVAALGARENGSQSQEGASS